LAERLPEVCAVSDARDVVHDKAFEKARTLVLVTVVTVATAAAQGIPSRLWSNLDRVVVRCSAPSENEFARATLCAVILDEVRHLSPYPVERYRDDSATGRSPRSLLIEARFFRQKDLQFLQVSVRRAISIDDSEGTRTLPPVALGGPASRKTLRAVVSGALARALPWRRDAFEPTAKIVAAEKSSSS